MQNWQKLFLLLYSLLSLAVFAKGFYECKFRKNAFGLTPYLFFFGIFVWGDVVVFGLFWTGVSLTSLILNDWILFLLVISVFWVVRSLGETIYWFNQQFTGLNKNPANKLPLYSIFENDSVWFIYQIFWQCVTVVSIIFSIYFTKLWLDFRF